MQSGRMFAVAEFMGTQTIQGETGYWVRARLAVDYRMAPKIQTIRLIPALDPESQADELPPPERPLKGFTNQDPIQLQSSFFPLGKSPTVSDIFYMSEPEGGFPMYPPNDNRYALIYIDIQLDEDRSDAIPPTQLYWEYLGASGWAELPNVTDTTEALLTTGKVSFTLPETVRGEVNGQENAWIRARVTDNGYGREAEFLPVHAKDATQGFELRSKTGIVVAPVVQSHHIDYSLERPPTVLTQNGFFYHDRTAENTGDDSWMPFVSVQDLRPEHQSEPMPAMYLGLDNALPEQPVTLYVVVTPRAISGHVIHDTEAISNPSTELAPLQWAYFNGHTWRELSVIDGSQDGTESGPVTFLTPIDIAPLARFDLTPRYWIRAQSATNDPFDTQRWLGVFLNTVPALQAETVSEEVLGSGSGLPTQSFQLSRQPVLSGQEIWVREPEPPSQAERADIEAAQGADAVITRRDDQDNAVTWVKWREAPNFLATNPRSRAYTIDRTHGRITFGNGRHGLIPPRGTDNIRATYRTGGGVAGNAVPGAISKLQSTIAGVSTVSNPVAAAGGAPLETVVQVAERGPQTLRHRQRAVTSSDIEWLARQAAGTSVARAQCLPNINRDLRFEPGWITLIIVPQEIHTKKPEPSAELIRLVEDDLAQRAFAGLTQQSRARINVTGPGYVQVSVRAEIVPLKIGEAQAVKQRVLTALDAFFQPLTGGPRQSGWPFGRDVYDSELCQLLESLDGVSYVKHLELIPDAAQHRLVFATGAQTSQALPAESRVQTSDARKVAVLAEPLGPNAALDHAVVNIKGFKESNRITRIQDMTVTQRPDQGGSQTQIAITLVGPFDMLYPRGSMLMTQDGRMVTHLRTSLYPSEAEWLNVTIEVEDEAFVNNLQADDVLTVFYPFPMTITSIRTEGDTQILSIHPYELPVAFPAGSLIATLDNRVRLPLHTAIEAPSTVTALTLENWEANDTVILTRRDRHDQPAEVTVQHVQPTVKIVYIDDNFLVYPGVHRIYLISE